VKPNKAGQRRRCIESEPSSFISAVPRPCPSELDLVENSYVTLDTNNLLFVARVNSAVHLMSGMIRSGRARIGTRTVASDRFYCSVGLLSSQIVIGR
jgi:hypothetical protein